MNVVMVKKRLASGEPCRKCAQTEEMLRRRGLWDQIDEVVWADESDASSPGMLLAALHKVEVAPFFLLSGAGDTAPRVITSGLDLIRHLRADAQKTRALSGDGLASAEPIDILRWGLERFGAELVIAFSGSDDVVLIDMASQIGLPFSVLTVDTGRLHPQTYEHVEAVRTHYNIEIDIAVPAPAQLAPFVRTKGLFSFYEDGHGECCGIRKVEPLRNALAGYRAWATGQRRDQAVTRTELAVIEDDPVFAGADGILTKLNPLASWTRERVWRYIRERDVPYNPLFDRGFASIGCAPCTRPIGFGQDEREGRWWWENAESKECGLHAGNVTSDAHTATGE